MDLPISGLTVGSVLGRDVPGQQGINLADSVHIGDLRENVAQVDLGVNVVELRCAHDGVDGGIPFSARIGTGEQVILPADGNSAHRVLGNVVVDLEPSVGDKSRQCFTPIERVAERLGQVSLRR